MIQLAPKNFHGVKLKRFLLRNSFKDVRQKVKNFILGLMELLRLKLVGDLLAFSPHVAQCEVGAMFSSSPVLPFFVLHERYNVTNCKSLRNGAFPT